VSGSRARLGLGLRRLLCRALQARRAPPGRRARARRLALRLLEQRVAALLGGSKRPCARRVAVTRGALRFRLLLGAEGLRLLRDCD